MLTSTPSPNPRLALECRYDGPIPVRYRCESADASPLRLGPVLAALARRRRRLTAAAAAEDPVLVRMSRHLMQAVRDARRAEPPDR